MWPDGESDTHRSLLAELRKLPTFAVAVAVDGNDLAGFAYGHRLPADHGWWQDFPRELPADLTEEWEGRTFAVIDLAVAASRRRQGLGRRLVERLLHGREEQRAVLSVQPPADAAHTFYERTGWWLAGRKGPMAGVVPPCWDIYVRTLTLAGADDG